MKKKLGPIKIVSFIFLYFSSGLSVINFCWRKYPILICFLFYREYFSKEADSPCTVEFFKQSDMGQGDKMFVALRFQTKDIARDIFDR